MAASNFVNVTSPQHFKDLLSADLNRVSCLNFWAPWAEPCAAFTKAVEGEATKFPGVLFLSIEAEELADISESFDIEAVPSFLLLRRQRGVKDEGRVISLGIGRLWSFVPLQPVRVLAQLSALMP
ncbi:monothiol glutaredoxin grx4 [Saitozyma podzolica]|uniref:Monothiol glutaredoxin grx4 n=1 Tax=Saitozyma podzolica TaxID=1890683 RepID=A0A427YNE2_9TREE|nr:monothiol glutaredoxin grx4 [Saitozyma podzolica]